MLTEDLHDINKLLTISESKYFDRKAAEYDKTRLLIHWLLLPMLMVEH